MTQYTTLTTKGQLTIPAAFRESLDLQAGKRIAISFIDGTICIRPQSSLDEVRPLLQEEMRKKKTLMTPVASGDGMTAYVNGKYAG
jgi:AbrB family looped-hinge helix DNA binding protein